MVAVLKRAELALSRLMLTKTYINKSGLPFASNVTDKYPNEARNSATSN